MCGYEDAVDLAATILKSNRITAPAVELSKLCDAYGLTIMETRLLGRPAMLDRSRKTIHVARLRPERAALFVAHELAHWLLPPTYGEESCDTLAYCVVMPHEWIQHDLAIYPVKAISTRYGVTAQAVRVRLRYMQMEFDLRWE